MKRHDALIPLTHDHHHALAQARRLHMSSEGDPERWVEAARAFLEFYKKDTLAHFHEEEEEIFPLVVDEPEVERPLTRVLLEHLRIHRSVHKLQDEVDRGSPSAKTMAEISTLLQDHIRFEEKTLFPLVERLAPTGLGTVELAARNR